MRPGRLTSMAFVMTIILSVGAVSVHLFQEGMDGISRETMVLVLPIFAGVMANRGRRFPTLALIIALGALALSAIAVFAVMTKKSMG